MYTFSRESLVRWFRKVGVEVWIILPLLLVTLYAAQPLFSSGFYNNHEEYYPMIRTLALDSALHDGQFPVRWSQSLAGGYGYPLFNYYAPLSYYTAEVVHVIGFNFLNSIKIVYGLGLFFAGISMYVFVRALFGKNAGILAGMLYIFIPYHLVDIFPRGNFAESFVFWLLPFVLWSVYQLVRTGKLRYLAFLSLSFAALICTHNLTAFFFAPIMALFALFTCFAVSREPLSYPALKNRKVRSFLERFDALTRLGLAFVGVLLAAGLSAWYWAPAFFERSAVQLNNLLPTETSFLPVHALLSGLPVGNTFSFMGIQFALLHVVLFVFGLSSVLWSKDKNSKYITLFFVALTLGLVYLISPASRHVWSSVAPALTQYIQFTWRLLAFTSVTVSVVAGAVFAQTVLRDAEQSLATVVLALCAVFIISTGTATLSGLNISHNTISTADIERDVYNAWEAARWPIGTTSSGEYLPKTVAERPAYKVHVTDDPLQLDPGSYKLVSYKENTQQYTLSLANDQSVVANSYFFPGVQAVVDGKRVAVQSVTDQGLVGVSVPAGDHTLSIRYGDTRLRTFVDVVSIVSFILLLALVYVAIWQHYLFSRRQKSIHV